MSSKKTQLSLVIGTLLTAVSVSPLANASENPFGMTMLSSGYQVADNRAAEGKCGASKSTEGKCASGKSTEGKCASGKSTEGKCASGKAAEGKCAAKKSGEGKCGGVKAPQAGCGYKFH